MNDEWCEWKACKKPIPSILLSFDKTVIFNKKILYKIVLAQKTLLETF